ncbi:hypothetical protein [Acidimangrovimonas pyrenivorans]|uniref:Uncharacterized protein n=1 Tax=Acidimangrovimonas pyrenivorans TaxID=2030798 RepID=A0ABV7ANL2_9RHOB
MRKFLLAFTAAALLAPLALHAGAYDDFEGQMRDAYSNYRVALLMSNQGKADKTAEALGAMAEKWTILEDAWKTTPPPQYADDPGFADTLDRVAKIIASARQTVRDGDVAKAHVALEKIRTDLGALHLRNGLMWFSDRLNAYHVQMEETLTADYSGQADGGLERMREQAAVLVYLAHDLVAHPSVNSADPDYPGLVKALVGSAEAFQAAARGGDVKAALAARAGLKPAYAKLFIRFG